MTGERKKMGEVKRGERATRDQRLILYTGVGSKGRERRRKWTGSS